MKNFLLITSATILFSAVNSEPFTGENSSPQTPPELLNDDFLEFVATAKSTDEDAGLFADKSAYPPEKTATLSENSAIHLEKLREEELFTPLLMKIIQLSLETKMEMAKKIVTSANLGLDLIDSFKDGFVLELLGMDWTKANQRYYPGCISNSYLPSPPQNLCDPCDLDAELTRSYALMQHCVVSLEVLNLDQALKDTIYSYFGQVNRVADHVIESLNYLESYMNQENCFPDGHETDAMTSQIYEEVNKKNRGIRDFVILRDVRASFQNIRDTFMRF